MIKKYVNKDGYKIRASEKAYHLTYKKMGFMPVDKSGKNQPEAEITVSPPTEEPVETAENAPTEEPAETAVDQSKGNSAKSKPCKKTTASSAAKESAGTAEGEAEDNQAAVDQPEEE